MDDDADDDSIGAGRHGPQDSIEAEQKQDWMLRNTVKDISVSE